MINPFGADVEALLSPNQNLLLWFSPLCSNAEASESAHEGQPSNSSHEGGHDSAEHGADLSMVLLLVTIVATAYLLSHFLVDWLRRRFLFLSGLEYVGIGMLMGPVVFPGLNPFDDLTALAPIFAFAAGWIGLLYGMQLDLRELVSLNDRSFRIAAISTIFTGGLVASGAYLLLSKWIGIQGPDLWVATGVLGSAAAATSSNAVDLVAERYPSLKTELMPQLRRATRLGDWIAILAFGTILCVFHQGETLTNHPPVPSDWILLTVGIGLTLGMVFSAYLSDENSGTNDIFLTTTGILLFGSGAAIFLNLSSLSINLILGAVLVQFKKGRRVQVAVESTAKPVSLVLLIFAGALWVPTDLTSTAVLCFLVIFVRTFGRIAGAWMACVGTNMPTRLGFAMLAQGDAAVAMAISMQLIYDGPGIDLAYTAILASVVVHDLVAPRQLRTLLVDTGAITEDLGWKSATPEGNPSPEPVGI